MIDHVIDAPLLCCWGSPPCQRFSLAAHVAVLQDLPETEVNGQRDLYKETIRLGASLAADVIVIENVAPVVSKDAPNGRTYLENIVRALERAGYVTTHRVLNAADYGVPQERKRLFVVGLRRKSWRGNAADMPAFEWPKPVVGFDPSFGTIMQSEREVIASGKRHDYSYYMPPEKIRYYVERKKRLPGHVKWVDPSKTARTLLASYMKSRGSHALIVRDKNGRVITDVQSTRQVGSMRMYTVEECKRIMSFPDDFVFPGTMSSTYKQLGNAVPVNLAYHIARAVSRWMDKIAESREQ